MANIEVLKEWNPWWFGKGGVIDELKGEERHRYDHLINSIDTREIIIITGVRRSGKTTIMYQMIDKLIKKGIKPEQILFINFEDKKLSKESLDDLYVGYRENINADKKAFIFLDEIHRKESWESWIRKKYDLKTKDKFVISGSCSYLLKKEYSTLLTGRNLTFEVYPFSFREFLNFKNLEINEKMLEKGFVLDEIKYKIIKYLKEYIEIGGFPQVFFEREEFKVQLLKQYFDDILYKDIIDRYNITSQKTKDLAQYLITNFTSLISLRILRNSLKLSYDTIKNNLNYYTEAFLFFIIDHFSYSLKEQKTLPSKIYCIDNGLRNAVSFKFSKDKGKLVENLVLIELKRRGEEVYYWTNKGEIDFIIKNKDQTLTAINVTCTNEINEREIKIFQEFRNKFKSKIKSTIILTEDLEQYKDGVKYIPLWKWLLEVKTE
jgi:predicted AAA+ superfamily ATPase